MKKITILIFFFFLSINVFADEWPHENISNAEFALDIVDRIPINIIEELDNSLGKIYFLQISVICKAKVSPIAGFTKTKLWQI